MRDLRRSKERVRKNWPVSGGRRNGRKKKEKVGNRLKNPRRSAKEKGKKKFLLKERR